MQITSTTEFEWFPAEQINSTSPAYKMSKDYKIRQRMYELASSNFVFNLLQNYRLPNNFPAASFYCLQILAFWLSWIRYYYTKDRKLNLSLEILHALREWSQRKDLPKQEIELATKLYDDFSREPPLEELRQEFHEEKKSEVEKSSVSETSRPPSASEAEAEGEKNSGNEFFKSGQYSEAIEAYSRAIQLSSDRVPATYFTNRSAAYMKRNSGQGSDLSKGLLDCDRAIQLDPNFAKAYYRKAQILELLGLIDEAFEQAAVAKSLSQDKAIAQLADDLFAKQREKMKDEGLLLSSPGSLIQGMASASEPKSEEEEEDPIQVFLSKSSSNSSSSSSSSRSGGGEKGKAKPKKALIEEI